MPGLKVDTIQSWVGKFPEEKQIEYVQADRRRTEFRGHVTYTLWPGGPTIWVHDPRTATIFRCDLGQMFTLNLDRRTYAAAPYPRVPTEAERRAYAERFPKEPARKPTVLVEIITVDTGERKEIFGQTARRVITTHRETPMATSNQPPKEYVTDGWYTDLDASVSCDPKPTPGKVAIAFLTASEAGKPVDFPEVKFVGKPETGLALSTTMTSHLTYTTVDGSKRDNVSVVKKEVVALSTGAIDPALFEIPSGFSRVDRMDLSPSIPLWAQLFDRAHSYWPRLKMFFSRR